MNSSFVIRHSSFVLSHLWTRPKINRWLTLVCLISCGEDLWTAFQWRDPSGVAFAGLYLLLAITANIPESEIKNFICLGCLTLSAASVRFVAWLTEPPLELTATISGHTSKHDPAEAPVLIADLLSILDRARGKSVELEIPGYRMKATKVSPFDDYIEKHAGRDGTPLPEITPWFADR